MRPAAAQTRRATAAALLLGASVAGGGCQRVLFPDNLPRTQFEAHDRLRSGYVPLEQPDVFGNPQPALRSRLSGKR